MRLHVTTNEKLTDRRRKRALAANPASENPGASETETRRGGSCGASGSKSLGSHSVELYGLKTSIYVPACYTGQRWTVPHSTSPGHGSQVRSLFNLIIH